MNFVDGGRLGRRRCLSRPSGMRPTQASAISGRPPGESALGGAACAREPGSSACLAQRHSLPFASISASRGAAAGSATSAAGPVVESTSGASRERLARGAAAGSDGDDAVILTERAPGGHTICYFSGGPGKPLRAVVVNGAERRGAWFQRLLGQYILPEGYPFSVSASYTPYMQWRAVQFFFGGAISVFTTRSLMASLGVGKPGASAVALNWVIKEGAGRLGKVLFARMGKHIDCDLKQFRLGGNLLMECGAVLELCTTWAPSLFLPLACAANLMKNAAAVASAVRPSTRAPIYKSFALQNNLSELVAKAECMGNLSDLCGTACGLALAALARGPHVGLSTWAVLSACYLVASFNETAAVTLPTLNRARLAVAARHFFASGKALNPWDGNRGELAHVGGATCALLGLPVAAPPPLLLGAPVGRAFSSVDALTSALERYRGERYVLGYDPHSRQVTVVVKDGATPTDVLRATFHCHLLHHTLAALAASMLTPVAGNGTVAVPTLPTVPQSRMRRARERAAAVLTSIQGRVVAAASGRSDGSGGGGATGSPFDRPPPPGPEAVAAAEAECLAKLPALFSAFMADAADKGWSTRPDFALLNTGSSRLVETQLAAPPSFRPEPF